MRISFSHKSIAAIIVIALVTAGAVSKEGSGGNGETTKLVEPVAPLPKMFVGSNQCLACHNDLNTADGKHVSMGADWRSSMMAHAALDPYWQAGVRREIIDHPDASAAIQDECAKCHMPMSRYRANAKGEKGEIFAHLPPTTERPDVDSPAPAPAGQLAAEGVSCVTCHQIAEEGLGTEESFTGGFRIDSRTPADQREIYGPYATDDGRKAVMNSSSDFVPVRHAHIQNSALCASCHTLYTHTLDENGEVVGELPEQVPYLEWRHSDYEDRESCQDCHMPELAEPMPITSVLGQNRENFSQHSFRGANFFVQSMLRKYADELGVTAPADELQSAIDTTLEHLRTKAGKVAIHDLRTTTEGLEFAVTVRNLSGHKLPTAYPSRRIWLHVTITDASGKVVFESGALRSDGSIAGNDNDEDPRRYEPHHAVVRHPGQVPVYEAIMATPAGTVTTGLLSADRFIKDNRVLPDGFVKATAGDDIAVRGEAARDDDFTGGRDTVRYQVRLEEPGDGPHRIHAELWYQPVAFRWAQNLDDYDAMETQRFVRYYRSMSDRSAVRLAKSTARTD